MSLIENKEVGKRIKKIRTESFKKKMTQTEFGQLVTPPVKKSSVRNWESGDNLPSNERLKQIADIGSVTTDYLLFGKEKFGIGERLKKQREAVSLSKEELARYVSPSTTVDTIDSWENEVTFPSMEELRRISELLHTHYLFFLTGEKRQHETDAYHISPYKYLDEVENELDKFNFSPEDRVKLDRDSKIFMESRLLSVKNPEMYTYVTHLLKQINYISLGNFDKDSEYQNIINCIDHIFDSLEDK